MDFIHYLEHGFMSPLVAVKRAEWGLSLVATGDLAKQTKILELPAALLKIPTLTTAHEVSSHAQLALYLLHNNDPWIDAIPKTWDTFPILWTDAEVRLLPTHAQKLLEVQKTRFEQDKLAASQLGAVDGSFLDSWLAVNSRCVYCDLGKDKHDNMVLAPVFDFLNHSSDQESSVQVVVEQGPTISVYTQKDYTANQEIHLCYGAHDNAFLLVEYGFVCLDNKWDYIDITRQIMSMLDTDTIDFLKQHNYLGDYTLHWTGASFRTFTALAALVDRKSALNIVLGFDDGTLIEPVVEKLVKEICVELLAEYSSMTFERQELRQLYMEYTKLLEFSIA